MLLLFTTGLIFFLFCCSGIFDGISAKVSALLYNWLGYTNKWSKSYGPSWFVNLNGNVSSFGSKELVFIISTIFFIYLQVTDRKIDAYRFAITVITSLLFIITVKYINSSREIITLKEIYTESLAKFPSGHTFISTVLYPSIAYFMSKDANSQKFKLFYFATATAIVLIVGISRVTGSGHTVTEVIAGWSLGLCWFALIKMFLFNGQRAIVIGH